MVEVANQATNRSMNFSPKTSCFNSKMKLKPGSTPICETFVFMPFRPPKRNGMFFFWQDTTKHAVSCFQHLNCQHNEKGQLRLFKRRPNPFQLEKGAIEVKEDEVFVLRWGDMILMSFMGGLKGKIEICPSSPCFWAIGWGCVL